MEQRGQALPQKRVAIVLGHRVDKPGAYSPFLKMHEYEFNSGLLHELAVRLSDFDTTVYIKDGLTTPRIYEEIGKRKPDIAIELHFNSDEDARAYGTEVLCGPGWGWYARFMQNALVAGLKRDNKGDRGYKICKPGDRGYDNVSLLTYCCTLLLEPFFGSNEDDCKLIQERRTQYLDAIEAGVRKILTNPIPDPLLPGE